MKNKFLAIPFILSVNILTFSSQALTKTDSGLESKIKLPKGFHIEVFAKNIDNARSMAMGAKGTLFVGSRGDKVYAVVDTNKDNKADKVITIAKGLNMPNGVAFRNGSLYVAEINRVLRYDNIEDKLNNVPKPVVITTNLPSETHHGWKYIAFGPDNKLYVPVGAPCNICKPDDPRFAAILRMNADGSGQEVFASGIRNTVGFDWNPNTKDLWFTENGRDMLGDNIPPDELNTASKKGMNFGYPYCHAGTISDPEFGSEKSCKDFTPPAMKLGPHVASLGMKFYKGNMFPATYKNKIFIAEHGSWNRSKQIGYRITAVQLENNKATKYEVFAEGWLKGNEVSGRPVDILIKSDGSMLVSDDTANMIYRITYK